MQNNSAKIPIWFDGIILSGLTLISNWLLGIPSNIVYSGVSMGALVFLYGLFKGNKLELAIQTIYGQEVSINHVETKKYGMDIYIPLPCGMSLKDFEDKKEALEQHLNAEVEFIYKDKQIKAIIRTGEIMQTYPYYVHSTPGPIDLIMGYSRDGLEVLSNWVHMLIAGETGSGKSVALRQIITTLIITKKIILNLVDFKRVELGIFKKCCDKFCRTPEEFEILLTELEQESERRYSLFESHDLVNIQSWNKKYTPLPYIITIVDEYGDIYNHKELKDKLIKRLQKDRACGIHYILACQRPSAKILDGDIKANIPTILSFKTSNRLNSQIILDDAGAEELPGEGAGLLKHKGKLKRIQTMYLSEVEAQRLIKPYTKEKKCEVISNANRKRQDPFWTNRKV